MNKGGYCIFYVSKYDRVPYTGARSDVSLGVYDITATEVNAGNYFNVLGNYSLRFRNAANDTTYAYISYDGSIHVTTINGASDIYLEPGSGVVNVSGKVSSQEQAIKANAGTGTGTMTLKSIRKTHVTTNAQQNTITINVPAHTKIVACQLRNDTAIAGTADIGGAPIADYTAEYNSGGISEVIAGTIALPQNTKVDAVFDGSAGDVPNDVLTIMIDARVGNKFTAGGEITAIVYYFELTSMTDIT